MNFTSDGSPAPKNYWGIGIVVVLHVILIYALVNGLARKVVDVIKQPVETTIIKEEIIPPPMIEKPPEPPKMVEKASVEPQPPKVETPSPQTFVPKAEVQTTTSQPTAQIAVTSNPVPQKAEPAPTPPAPTPAAPEPAPPNRTSVATGSRTGCATPEYPASALQNEEAGITSLALLIGTDGKVTDAKVDKSSGSKALDRAAMNALKLCVFKPATLDGKPVQEWIKLQYEWALP